MRVIHTLESQLHLQLDANLAAWGTESSQAIAPVPYSTGLAGQPMLVEGGAVTVLKGATERRHKRLLECSVSGSSCGPP